MGAAARERCEMRKSESFLQPVGRRRTKSHSAGGEVFNDHHRAATLRTGPKWASRFSFWFGNDRGWLFDCA
jgi:hypothetical protein